MVATLDQDVLNNWLGKTERAEDVITARQANLMCATLGRSQDMQNGDPLPDLWHWLYFPVAYPSENLGRDGHPKLGGFLPLVDLPRRMWAGGRFEFFAPLLLGEVAQKTSRIEQIKLKTGRTGALCFVTVSHTITANGQSRFREEHDIVYREDPTETVAKPTPLPAPKKSDWQQEFTPDPVMLFRYSALTFNGHRIHYDRIYAREVEGYSDLIVHGPLIATLLVDLATSNGGPLARFSYRAHAPIFDAAPFTIHGARQTGELWAKNPDGTLAMQAQAEFM